MVRFFDVSKLEAFKSLKRVLLLLTDKTGADRVGEIRRDANAMLVVEGLFVSILRDLSLLDKYSSLQFPVNVRRVAASSSVMAAHEYDTHDIHVDTWSGAPSDSANFMLYLDLIGEQPPYVQFYEFLDPVDAILKFRGAYRDAINQFPVREVVHPPPVEGQLVYFDNFSPHRTVSVSNCYGSRLSIDARVRVGNPYQINGGWVEEDKFVYYSPGNPGLGYYWSIIEPWDYSAVSDKVNRELIMARALDLKAFQLRQAYLNVVRSGGIWDIKRVRPNQ